MTTEERATLDALTTRRHIPTEDVPIPGVGTVTVRGVTRAELLGLPQDVSGLAREQHFMAMAMVDPEMTRDQVAAWQACSPPAEIDRVAQVANRLSGLGEGQAKAEYKSVRNGQAD